jgi:TM2 domain-containing membrane protein YozV
MPIPEGYSGETDAVPHPEPEVSDRSRGVALALALVGGWAGLHRFYVGKTGTGLAMICTFGGIFVWWLYDLILIASGEFRDSNDLPLRRWTPDDPRGFPSRGAERRVDELEERLEALRGQFNELAERVDFAERMLAQHRERPQLPRG